MIRVVLPAHLRTLAKVSGEVSLDLAGQPTILTILDALESRYPALRGTIRDQITHQRRPFVRYFACQEDLSFASESDPLPPPISNGEEPFLIVGAMAGG